MKKALAILVSALLVMSLCVTASAGSFALAFDNVEVEEGTADVTVPLNITANDGIWAFILEVTYDTSVLTFNKAEAPAFNVTPNEATPGTVKLVFDAKEMANVTDASGAVANLSFAVVGAAGSESAIAATCPDPASNIDVDFNDIETSVAAGSVKIVAKAEPSETEPSETEPSETKATEATEASETEATEATETEATETEATDAPVSPATGSAIPAAAIVLAAASAAVLGFARKK